MHALQQMGLVVWFCVVCSLSAFALEPAEVVVLVNKNSADSVKLGEYYAEKRGVPKAQIIALDLPMDEDLARARYTDYVVPTVRQWLTENKLQDRIRCIVTTYGIPLRVNRRFPSEREKSLLSDAAQAFDLALLALTETRSRLDSIPQQLPSPPVFDGNGRAETPRKRIDVEQQIRDLESSFAAAQKRVSEIKDDKARTLAEMLLSGYQRSLHVGARGLDAETARKKREELVALDRRLSQQIASPDEHHQWISLNRELRGLVYFIRLMDVRCKDLAGRETEAAFDSELSLLWWDNFQLYRWLSNSLIAAFDRAPATDKRNKVLMVARLDAPTPEIARRLVDDALAVEAVGLTGNIYIDARDLGGHPPRNTYGEFDEQLRQTARFLQDKTTLKVVLDNKPALFQRGDCPDAALYCGWYSLSKYVDAFKWKRGAVAYHVASGEAYTLRRQDSQVWCKRMLEEGVTATLGPVAEPYLGAFPSPRDFFALLMTGKWTLAECYYRTVPWHSWMMTLVGDPLYRPFEKNPALKVEDLPRGLAIPENWAK